MPSKLRRAIGAVKDQTSIGLARLAGGSSYGSSKLEVAVLRATSHEESPMGERCATEVVLLASASPAMAANLIHVLTRRVTRTRNWVVALKSLSLTFLVLRDGGPYFPREVLAASRRRGPRLLELSGFVDESSRSSSWDFTAFVRTFALYLDARLECFLLGKLRDYHRPRPLSSASRVISMKPSIILDCIGQWQQLVDRAMRMRPTRAARINRLVLISLYPVVRESIGLYRDISDGLYVLLDNFFNIDASSRLDTFHACAKAEKQFLELESFYIICKDIGVGRTSEYPRIGRISKTLLQTMEEFFKDEQQRVSSSASLSPAAKALATPLKSLLSAQMNLFDDQTTLNCRPVVSERYFPAEVSPTAGHDGDGWELVLVESARNSWSRKPTRASLEPFDPSSFCTSRSCNNPFTSGGSVEDEKRRLVSPRSASVSLPTFRAERPWEKPAAEAEEDPFGAAQAEVLQTMDEQQQQLLLREQQLWMKNQDKIIARNKQW